MSVIGTLAPAKDGGWVGAIRTLTIEVKARFVPNDNQGSDQVPAFRIFSGCSEIGAAWRERSSGEHGRNYSCVRLDDSSPNFEPPVGEGPM
ncbi:MAG: DUF736 domain-containing protein [Stellaceae bacterium]